MELINKLENQLNALKNRKEIKGFFGEYRWLSNFWPVRIVIGTIAFPSVEHAYQAAKTGDLEIQKQISLIPTAGQAKRFGRTIAIRSDWNEVKLGFMKQLLEQKFKKEPFKTQLIETGNAYLEETNPWKDYFWGVCDGKGQNHLGLLIWEIRKQLQKTEEY